MPPSRQRPRARALLDTRPGAGASICIAAGVNAKALSTYLGHSSIQTTIDRYGHLMPGNEDEAAALVDAYLERAGGARTGAHAAQPLQ